MPDRLKLLQIIPTLDQSGAEKQFAHLCTMLDRKRYDVSVICLTRGGHYEQMLRNAGIDITIYHKRFKFDPIAMWRLKQQITQTNPDLIHTWLFAANAYTRLVVPAQYKDRVVVSERCVDSWKAGWQLWLDKKLIPNTARLVGNSSAVVEFYRNLGYSNQQLRCLHNGIDLPENLSEDNLQCLRQSILKAHQLPEQARIVLTVSRLAPQKRIKDLLWGMQLLRQVDPRYHLVILGDGPQMQELIDHARGCEVLRHCHFLGHLDPSDFYRIAECYWQASEFEGLSNSLMEAMSHGLPCVVSDIPPNRELIDDQVHGLLVRVGDSAMFAQQTRRLSEGPEPFGEQLGLNARMRIADEFSLESMVNAYDALYTELTNLK